MNRLKMIRESSGLTSVELAKLLGVSKQAIHEWEKGNRKIPDSRKSTLAEIFKTKESDFDEISVNLSGLSDVSFSVNGVDCSFHRQNEEDKKAQAKRLLMYAKQLSYSKMVADYKDKKIQQKELEKRIHRNISGNEKTLMADQISHIDRVYKMFDHLNNIVERLDSLDPEEVNNYCCRIMELFYGVESAMGVDTSIDSTADDGKHRVAKTNIELVKKRFKEALKASK